MSKVRSVWVSAVFLLGCAMGEATSRFVVPPASAQQVAGLTKWEYTCVKLDFDNVTPRIANDMGDARWEMFSVVSHNGWLRGCFKRPKS